MIRPVAILLLCSALLPGVAAAEELEAEAAVITIPSATTSPEEATAALAPIAGRLRRSSGREVMLPQVAVTRLARRDGQRRLDEARSDARRARETLRAFENLDLAADLLEGAATSYLDLLPLLDRTEEPVSLFRDLATVHLAQDDPEGVDEALIEAARLDVRLRMDVDRDPRRLREAAARVRDRVGDDLPMLTGDQARRYAELLGVMRLGVARLLPSGEVQVDVYHRSRGSRTVRLDLDPRDLEGAARALGEALAITAPAEVRREAPPPPPDRDDVDLRPSRPVERDVDVREEPPWYASWWFWTTVGVVVAGTVLITAILASDLGD